MVKRAQLNRFNRIYLMIFIIMGGIFLGACKKKDRLTSSTFTFSITPPAKTVVQGVNSTVILRTQSNVSPTWVVEPASAQGKLNVSEGPNVTFAADELGDYVITATADGSVATSQIAVVSYIPIGTGGNVYEVYTDRGLPNGMNEDSNIFPFPINLNFSTSTTGYTPEGIEYIRTINASTADSWAVTIDSNTLGLSVDLSGFSTGNLVFSIRLVNRALALGDILDAEIQDSASVVGTVSHTSGNWTGFDPSSTNWQEVSISLALFFAAINESQVVIPFRIQTANMTATLTFDIDAVRWEK